MLNALICIVVRIFLICFFNLPLFDTLKIYLTEPILIPTVFFFNFQINGIL